MNALKSVQPCVECPVWFWWRHFQCIPTCLFAGIWSCENNSNHHVGMSFQNFTSYDAAAAVWNIVFVWNTIYWYRHIHKLFFHSLKKNCERKIQPWGLHLMPCWTSCQGCWRHKIIIPGVQVSFRDFALMTSWLLHILSLQSFDNPIITVSNYPSNNRERERFLEIAIIHLLVKLANVGYHIIGYHEIVLVSNKYWVKLFLHSCLGFRLADCLCQT